MPPNDSRTIDIALTATATGTFTSNVVLRAHNDSTPDNNTASVAITVNAPTSSGGGSSSGGGGGGGRFEWLALALLGGLVLCRGHAARGTGTLAAVNA
jgi:hypothetical protein